LQALVGAYWVKRYAGFPNGLRREKAVLLFLAYGGVLSTTINSSLSVAMLVATGKIPLTNALNNWLTWWSGDLFGVIIFTPLALAWLLKDTDSWRRRRLAITLPTLAMFALTAATVVYEAQSSNERIQLEFEQQSNDLNNAVKLALDNDIHILGALKSFFIHSSDISREEFKLYTEDLLKNYQDIQSMSWNPLIQSFARETFEKKIQQQGFPNFQIFELDANRQPLGVKQRASYVPVTYLEPYPGNEKALGYDISSDPTRLATLNIATDTGELTITPRLKLVQDNGQYSVLAIMPLYAKDLAHDSVEEKHLAIIGYIVGIIKTENVIMSALKHSNTVSLSYRLLDSSAPADEQLLYTSDQSFPEPLVIQEKSWLSPKKTLSSRINLTFGGRIWTFEIIPKQDYFATHRTGHTWLVMLIGLILTSLVTLVSLVASGHTRRLKNLVDQRTQELEQEHASLLLLAHDKEKLSMALEQSQSSVMITDLDTHIEYVNQAFVNSTGYSREEIIGQKPSLLKSDKTTRATYDAMWKALLDGKAWQGEVINRNKQGKELIELTWISPIRQADGSISHYLGVKEDITERKQKDGLLLAAKERAENLAKTKSQFLANMSHEIRTPMAAIIGFSDLALLIDMPTKVNQYVKNINTASNHLLTILNDILDLSKLEAGQMTLKLKHFELVELQESLHGLLINTAQAKGLAFTIDIAPQVPKVLIGDSLRLKQALINLLGNAIKFTQQGSVTLSISLLELTATETRLLFAVTDTGIGISPEQQDKLFQPFSQADDGFDRSFEGTGLGLAISQDLVRLMSGSIKLESRPGLGSCFSFELVLPLANLVLNEPQVIATSSLNPEALSGIRVLVAEDNAFNQMFVSEMLENFGASTVLVNNGLEALAALEKETFDIVLMDLHMPAMDGYEATLEIRKRPHYASLPVIAFTASVTEEEKRQCIATGMNDFVGKPTNKKDLLETLQRWLKTEPVGV
jgi:PAS domain S-box-containing protein